MGKKRKTLEIVLVSLSVSVIVTVLFLAGSFRRFDDYLYDVAVKQVRLRKPIADQVAVILIDEASLQALNPIVGRWPWPRAIYSELLEFLSMGRPRAVLFDILFTETQDPRSPKGEIGRNDRALADATVKYGFVYHAMQVIVDEEDERNRTILNRPMPDDFTEKFSLKSPALNVEAPHVNNNYYLPFTELRRAATGVGVVEFAPDGDGVFRRTRPLREYHGKYFPVMGLAALAGSQNVVLSPGVVQVGGKVFPLDSEGEYRINVYGKFKSYSISGIFSSLQKIRRGEVEDLIVDPSEFRDKIVFVGSSATGVEDLKPTPISAQTPGVYLHASLASNYLLNDFLTPPSGFHTMAAIYLFSILCVIGMFGSGHFRTKLAVPLGLVALWLAVFYLGFRQNHLFHAVPPIASVALSTLFSFGFLAMTEGREKLKVRKMFSQYVSPEVLDIMMTSYTDFLAIGAGTKEDITVLFSDIRGFTSFSDHTPPEKVVEMLNTHFSFMTEAIFRTEGTVDKFIGDAIMAYWGAPVRLVDHADRAVQAAMEMVRKVRIVNEELKNKGIDFNLRMGIGVNSGDAILGNIGSEKKLNYTVIGDTVNLASRLEYLNKNYEVPIIISEFTFRKMKSGIPCRVLDHVQVRGKVEPVRIYEPVVSDGEMSPDDAEEICARTNRAFEMYEKGDYKGALELYNGLEAGIFRDLWVARCRKALEG